MLNPVPCWRTFSSSDSGSETGTFPEIWGDANYNSVNFEQQTERSCCYGGLVTQIHAETSRSLTTAHFFLKALWSETSEQPRISLLTVKLSSRPRLKQYRGPVQRYRRFLMAVGWCSVLVFTKTNKQTTFIGFLEVGQSVWRKNFFQQPEAKCVKCDKMLQLWLAYLSVYTQGGKR